MHVFFAERETRKIPGLPANLETRPVKSGAIIGAGTMGGGIAICFANAGLPVTVVDASAEGLERGIKVIGGTYDSWSSAGASADEKAARMALIRGSLDYADIKDADVIIEAVYENLDLKKEHLRQARSRREARRRARHQHVDAGYRCDRRRDVSRPQDVIGLHFFSPANVMPLLEVIRTAKTSPAVIRAAMDLSRPLRKTAVLANICYGFIGNRMMEGYAREAERIVLEGATPRQVDTALEQWGMAMGILAVFDMAGIDVGVNVHKANAHQYPPDPAYYQADFALHAAGRLGQKNGKGYYRYVPGDRARHDDPEALEILRAKARDLGIEARPHTDVEILERCLYPLLNEGIRIIEEGVALRTGDVDVVWTSGYGFPRYRGGPLFHADTIGLPTLLGGILKYRQQFGPMHWEPAPLLTQLVQSGQTLAQWEAARIAAK